MTRKGDDQILAFQSTCDLDSEPKSLLLNFEKIIIEYEIGKLMPQGRTARSGMINYLNAL